LQTVAKSMDIPIVAAEKLNYGATDTTVEWQKILAAKPDVILLWGSGSTMSVTLRNGAQLGNTAPIIGAQGAAAAGIIKGAGAAAEGVYMITLNAPDKVSKEQEELARLYKAKNGPDYQLSIYDIIGWDAVHLYAKALELAKGDKSKMVDAMEQIRDYKLAGGSYTYAPNNHEGLGVDSVWIVQVRNGRMQGVQRGF
jgi:branched-chain amino acid transport system substrate-binding protein